MTERSQDDGFTLIEMLIAMIVMTIAVVALVAAMSGLIGYTQQNTGHGAVESTMQDFGQAVQARVSFHTTLATAIGASATSLQVSKGSGLPTSNFYITVDRETMLVGSRSGNTLSSVTRGQNDPASAVTHLVGAPVQPLFRCPTATDLTPATYDRYSTDVTATIDPAVEYWDNTTDSFVDHATCVSHYNLVCVYPDNSGSPQPDIRPECDPGVERLKVSVTTSGTKLKGVTTVGQIIVRRGSDSVG